MNELAPLAAAALVVIAVFVPPQHLILSTLVAFFGASIPVMNPGGIWNQFRWVLLIALVMGLILRSAVQQGSARWHVVHFSVLFFVVYAAVSSSYSINGLLTFLKALSFGALIIAAFLAGRLATQRQTASLFNIIEVFFWSTCLVAVGCVLALVHILPYGLHFFQGPFGNPNSLGAFIPLVAPILLLKAFHSAGQPPFKRALYIALPIAFTVFLLMSRSRGGIASTFLAVGWWLFFTSRKTLVWLAAITFVGGIAVATYSPDYVQSLNETYVLKGHSYILESREELFAESWDAARESPVIGVGFGVSRGHSEDWTFGFETGDTREKGNSYLALVEEVGVVGGAFLVLPFAWVMIASALRIMVLGRLFPSSKQYWEILTLSACLAGGLGDVFFEAWLTAAGFIATVMFWMLFGVLVARLANPIRVTE